MTFSSLDAQVQGTRVHLRVAVAGFEEFVDLGEHAVAVSVPLFPSAENEGAFAYAGEMDVLGTGAIEFSKFCAQRFKKCEFEAVAGGVCGPDEGDGDRGCERLEFLRDGIAADLDEHLSDALEEFIELQEPERAFVLKVELHAAFHFVDEREIAVIRGMGGAEYGFLQPRDIVIEHLVGADLDGWAIADE